MNCEYRSLRMFCNLDGDALAHFNSLGAPDQVCGGVRLFGEDERSDAVFVICTGQVKLSCISKEGKTLILKIAMPGDVLGLSAVLSGWRYEVTAETMEPSEIKKISRDDFLDFLEKNGQASMHAAKALSNEYKGAFVDARRLALSTSASGRLASIMLEWARAASCGRPEMKFNMRLTHDELADMIGSTRETVTRALTRFKKDRIIEIRGVSVLILSAEKLESFTA